MELLIVLAILVVILGIIGTSVEFLASAKIKSTSADRRSVRRL